MALARPASIASNAGVRPAFIPKAVAAASDDDIQIMLLR